MHRQEQLIRATRFAKRGWISTLHPTDVTPANLLKVINKILNDPRKPLDELREQGEFGKEGNHRMVEFFKNLRISITREGEEIL